MQRYTRGKRLAVGDYVCFASKLTLGLCLRPVQITRLTAMSIGYETPAGVAMTARRTSIMFVGTEEELSHSYRVGWELTKKHMAERDAVFTRQAGELKTLVGRLLKP